MSEHTKAKNSTYNLKNGRYTLGGSTEVSSATLEWWNKNPTKLDESDIVYFIEKKYEFRPDLLGYVFYADPGLWWVIAMHNGIIDPFTELVEGKMLFIPTAERVKAEIITPNVAAGGIKSTRTVR